MNETKPPNPLKGIVSRVTVKDLGLAALAAFLIAEGPLTPAARAPSIAIGLGGALFFLYWRLSRPARQAGAALKSPGWQVPLAVWGCLALFVAAAAPTLVWMYGEWTGSVWHNTHGMLIPVLMVMLGRNILRRMKPVEDQPSLWGFVFLVPGLALILVDAAAATRYVSALGIVIWR